MPQGNSYVDFTHWWMSFERLGSQLNLHESDWITQFDAALNYKGYFTKILEDIIQNDLLAQKRWSLQESDFCHQLVEDQEYHQADLGRACKGSGLKTWLFLNMEFFKKTLC